MPQHAPTSLPLDAEALRASEFPFASETTYLNAAAVAPIPQRTQRALETYNRRRAYVHRLSEGDFDGVLARSRRLAAQLIGADADEIALGGNTSFGINLAALSLPLRPGSVILASDREFPANVYPWMHRAQRDVRLELVPADASGQPDEERLLERLGRGDVSLFALSAVQFATGYRADLERFGRVCREQGIHFVVDGIQALGQVPLDVRAAQVDVLATGGHKWLCGPFGTGFAYVRRELLERMEPQIVGWTSMRACADHNSLLDYRYDFQPEARKFEVATPPFQDLAGLAESLELLLEVGIERIEAHVTSLLEPLLAWLAERPEIVIISDLRPGRRSGILCFRPPEAERAFQALQEAGIVCVLREGAIRLSPHLYNTAAEVERVVEVLAGLEAR